MSAAILNSLLVAGCGGDKGKTISGPEIEQLLRDQLTPASGSRADPSQIRCPVDRRYQDGETAKCSVPVGNGSVEILLITIFREGGGWRIAIDIQ
jgi:hypothetical protein